MKKALSGLLLASTLITQAQTDPQAEQTLQTFFRYVELAYVDSVNSKELAEEAMRSILEKLDPHSVYIPAKELQRTNESLVGNFEGIGIQFNILRDTIVVVSPISGGPSERLGIRSGDKIIKIDDKVVAGIGFTNQDVMDHLRGKKGTQVMVSMKRRNASSLIDFTITRDKIPIYSVDASYMASPKTGYIKLNRFAATTMGEIQASLDSLGDQGMKNLILDLRGNSGGYLQTAIDLADEFLSDKKLIVYTEGRSFPRDETFATKAGKFEKGKLIVLIDEGSASASEIVSGAVQDWDRGLVIGRRSFGKGLVQKPFALPDGSAMRLTISRYYTPSGRSIQRPYDEGSEAYYNDLQERFQHGEFVHADSIQLPDSLRYKTLVRERTVYGGGGIMPDIFVPLDTTRGSDYYTDLIRNGLFNDYTLDYLDESRKKLSKSYADPQRFDQEFDVNNGLMEAFLVYAEENGVPRDNEGLERSRQLIETLLKAMIARGVWGPGAFYQITNAQDETYRKALEVLEDNTFEQMKLSYK